MIMYVILLSHVGLVWYIGVVTIGSGWWKSEDVLVHGGSGGMGQVERILGPHEGTRYP